MNSIKNTFVAVLLLGASYGVYQALTTPDTTVSNGLDFETVRLDDNAANDLDEQFPKLQSRATEGVQRPPKPASPPPAFQGNGWSRPVPQGESLRTSPFVPATQQPADDSVQQAVGDPSDSIAAPIAVAGETHRDRPHDHALISALKKVTGESNASSPTGDAAALPSAIPTSKVIDDFQHMAKCQQLTTTDLMNSWPEIESQVEQGEYRKALGHLSRFYHSDQVTGPQRQKLVGWLTALAGKVIYSREHHFQGKPYIVPPNESLENLSQNWQVPADLIFNINQQTLRNENELVPGTELKVILGPFNAQIDKSDKTLTLYVKRMYAGQFSLTIDGSVPNGVYRVTAREGASSSNFGEPEYAIELENGVRIGIDQREGVQLGLTAREMKDLFVILNDQSHVLIRD